MADRAKTTPPPPAPDRRRLKIVIGITILSGLMLLLFWPVVKFLVSVLMG